MVTYQQLKRKIRKNRRRHCWSPALEQRPQRRGRFLRAVVVTPRKPNSARRKIGKIILPNRKRLMAKIPGSGYSPRKYATVLIRGHGHKDTPGVGYSIVRGA
jgi:small subunit ribosomal protein S12